MKNPVDLFRKITNISTCIMLMSLQSIPDDVIKNDDDNVYETNVKYEVRLDDFPPETALTKYTPFYRPNSIAGRSPLLLKYVNTLHILMERNIICFHQKNVKKKPEKNLKKDTIHVIAPKIRLRLVIKIIL
jgi:hypothetical protein